MSRWNAASHPRGSDGRFVSASSASTSTSSPSHGGSGGDGYGCSCTPSYASQSSDWNAADHPRDPVTGRFVAKQVAPTADSDVGLTPLPVYTGSNQLLHAVIGTQSRATVRATQALGQKRLYHATSATAATEISRTKQMVAGRDGMFGGGIYFADSIESALHKARYKEFIIEARVDLGRALVVEAPDRNLDLNAIREVGCHSVKGRGFSQAEWEYIVFESSRVCVEDSFSATDAQSTAESKQRMRERP
jgi:hypothetical protein